MRRKSHYVTNLRQVLPALLFVVAAGTVGVKVLNVSLAATYSSNPNGSADYCTLENGHTVLYGWGYDPEASTGDQPNIAVKVGSLTATLPTNVTNYRIAAVNAWIDSTIPGAPKMGTYGWRWEISGLYKGGSYAVSGTILNVGAGANTVLNVNSSNNLSSEGTPKAIFTSDKKVPDACLATAPVVTPPVIPPTPTTPTTPTTPKKTTTPTPSAPAAPAPSSDANAQVITGTTGVVLNIPTGNAAKVHVAYNKPGQPAIATDDQVASGDKVAVTLGNLSANADYQYTIVRTNSAGISATSPAATFKTFGFVAQVQLTTTDKKPVSGIVGTINDGKKTKATSSKDGKLTFGGLADGAYTISYTYKGHAFTTDVNTGSSSSPQFNGDGTPKVITLSQTVNVDKLVLATSTPKSKHSPIAPIILVLLLVSGVIWFLAWLRRRKQQQLATEYGELSSFGSTPLSTPIPTAAPVITPNHAAHAGESLRDMVILSMHDQAQHQAPVAAPQAPQTVAERSAALPPQQPSQLQTEAATRAAQTEHPKEPAHKPAHHKTEAHHGKPESERVLVIDHRKKIS